MEAPGVGCDVPAHSYIFPFEPNPNWSKCDADGAEIDKCIVDTVDKYGLKEPIVFDTKLVKSIWNQERCKWALELKQNDKIIHDEADFLTNGSGILNQWKMPGIAGLNQFTGKLVHTAAWDKAYDWTNEKIAVLGNGSSGIPSCSCAPFQGCQNCQLHSPSDLGVGQSLSRYHEGWNGNQLRI